VHNVWTTRGSTVTGAEAFVPDSARLDVLAHLVEAGRVPTIGGRTGKHQRQITQNLGQLIEFGNAPHADHGWDGLAAARHHDVAALGISHQPGDASLVASLTVIS